MSATCSQCGDVVDDASKRCRNGHVARGKRSGGDSVAISETLPIDAGAGFTAAAAVAVEPSARANTEPSVVCEIAEADRSGERIGRYILVDRIGTGSMGEVWRARHVDLGHEVAIKILAGQSLRGGDVDGRFLQEARVSAHMSHPNIVRVFDFERAEGLGAYIVMELLDGETLGSLLNRTGKLEPARAIAIGLQICAALSEAHKAGVIHRDLKPENVFLVSGEGDQVKLLDFGVAKLTEAESVVATQPGTVVGTPLYMSPEQLDGLEVDERTDVYAAGGLLFQMVTGERPYPVNNYRELVQAQEKTGPRRPSDLVPELDQGLSDAIFRAIALDRDKRFASADQLAAAIEQALGAAATARSTGPGSGKRYLLAAGAVALAAITALIVWRAASDDSPGRPGPSERQTPATAAPAPAAVQTPSAIGTQLDGGVAPASGDARSKAAPPEATRPDAAPPKQRIRKKRNLLYGN